MPASTPTRPGAAPAVGHETDPRGAPSGPAASIIVPTWNERENIGPLLAAICQSPLGAPFEVLVVDDASPDGTGEAVREAATHHPNVRLVQRAGKLGLSSAVMEGAAHSSGGIVVMMDGDLSHDPGVLPRLIEQIRLGSDVAVGSRYARGGALDGWPLHRRLGSLAFTWTARAVFRLRVRDPLSGFVAFRREVLDRQPTRFSARGFKLLLEVLATQPALRVVEVPITFVDRCRGSSKLDRRELVELLRLCGRLLLWRMQPRARRVAAVQARESRTRHASPAS
jgi:dolichol-phosphate mannosyltransferase